MNTTELKAAESALETALEQVRQLITSDPEPETKPEPVRGPLTVAPEIGDVYWCVSSEGRIIEATWTDHVIDRHRLDRGEVFASEPEPKPKPEPVRGPLTATTKQPYYWFVSGDGCVQCTRWDGDSLDRRRLARGNAFASKRDAEYKAAFDEIWGQPIGEWEPDSKYWFLTSENDVWHSGVISPYFAIKHHLWRKGEIGFGDAGKAELERRLAEQKKLDERFGL